MPDDTSNTNANAEAAKYRKAAAARKQRIAELEASLATLTKERDDALKALTETPTADKDRIAELEGTLRTRSHRDAFNRLASGKIKSEALDDAFALSGWKAESDDVDEENMGAVIGSLVESKPYLRVEDPTPPTEDSVSPPSPRSLGSSAAAPKPAPGFGRGPAPESKTNTTPKTYRL